MCNGVGGGAGGAAQAGAAAQAQTATKKPAAPALDKSAAPPDKNSELLAAFVKSLQSSGKATGGQPPQ